MPTDTEMIDFLEKLNVKAAYTGKCILRMSGTARGWRLHETDIDDCETFMTVREAIADFMKKDNKNG